ncbi:MAG: threonylcarbamoyl-AMP synthase [Ruminococcaceae bacterium]|nr:threonylcarbamoyl-AMP synthase [Oscillospiraceae bacterium]
MTKIIQVKDDLSVIDEAAALLAQGGLVAFPTETVYGLGANVLDEEAVRRIFQAKGRPQDNPLIVHVCNREMLCRVVKEIPQKADALIRAFWPGPLTIILEKSNWIPVSVTAGLATVAVRMPSHPAALRLIEKSGVPIAAPSANISGTPSTTRAAHVIADLTGKVDYIIDGGMCQVGLESTVIDLTGEEPQILRPGGVSFEELQEVLGKVAYEPALQDSRQVPKSPGMKYRHYAPKAELMLVEPKQRESIPTIFAEKKTLGKKTGLLCCSDETYQADVVINCGSSAAIYAQRLFDSLRRMDEEGVDFILAELPEDEGGIVPALKNRMLKAAGGRIVNCTDIQTKHI